MSQRCDWCGKKRLISRKVAHKPGVAGAQWKKRAPKTAKVSLPNLHAYKGKRFCTKCLRRVKSVKNGSRDWHVVAKGDSTGRRVKKLASETKTSKKTTQE